jgi:antitoxin (DNA-binding transcriptional repressor) of toxin-antitoxin stability system
MKEFMAIDAAELSMRMTEVLSLIRNGQQIVLTEKNLPIAIMTPCNTPPRIPGLQQGQIWMADDFNAPLPDDFWNGTQEKPQRGAL